MADVFLSYARGDRPTAERLASLIAAAGLTVWWDRHIKGGAEFSRDIEQQLEAAKRILVLWSKEAVESRWVRDEASVAADSRRLVSATIDGTPPPLGFRQFQTIDLTDWASKGASLPVALAEALEVEVPAPQAVRHYSSSKRRWMVPAIGALLLAGGVTVALVGPAPFQRFLSGESQREELALAIMPFETDNASGMDYVGVGIATALADSLAPLSGLKITANTSTKAMAGKGLTAPEIAQKLRVTHLLEGDVQRVGERYAISVRLIEGGSSEQIWTRRFEGTFEELQSVKRRIAHELAAALRARLGAGQGEIANRRDVDPRAYEAYLRALERVSVRGNREGRLEAIKQFRLAASIEPNFADAHAGYAYLMALTSPHQVGMPWEQLMAEQRRATARALELDPANKLALIAKSTALQNFEGNVYEALAITKAVLKKSPNFGPAHYSTASGLWMHGRTREALNHIDLSIEADPFDIILRFYRAQILYSLGDYQAVRAAAEECPEPCGPMSDIWMYALLGFGSPDDYREDFPKIIARMRANGLPAEEVPEMRGVTEATILSRPYKLGPIDDESSVNFVGAALEARLVGFQQGLRFASIAANNQQPDSILDILNDGRVTFTAAQRADPRYHQLFRHPKLTQISAARRKEGVTAGLPVFPLKPYTGR